ncbi:MAG: hypothetical protein ACK50J_12040 [Planctomyces sp.]
MISITALLIAAVVLTWKYFASSLRMRTDSEARSDRKPFADRWRYLFSPKPGISLERKKE